MFRSSLGKSLVVSSLVILGLLQPGCNRLRQAAESDPFNTPILSVGGQPITRDDLYAALAERDGRDELAHLVMERAIIRQAREQKVSVDPQLLQQRLDEMKKKVTVPEQETYAARQIQASLLLRGLILKTIPEKTRRDFYDKFKKELAQVDVDLLTFANRTSADQAFRALQGGADFGVVGNGGKGTAERHLGPVTWLTLAENVGASNATMVMGLPNGRYTRPLAVDQRYCILKVLGHKQTWDELKTNVEDRLVAAREPAYTRDLRQHITFTTPGSGVPQAFFPSSLPTVETKAANPFVVPTGQPSQKTGVFAAPSMKPSQAPVNDVFTAPTARASVKPANDVFAAPTTRASVAPGSDVFAAPSSAPSASGDVFAAPTSKPASGDDVFAAPSSAPTKK